MTVLAESHPILAATQALCPDTLGYDILLSQAYDTQAGAPMERLAIHRREQQTIVAEGIAGFRKHINDLHPQEHDNLELAVGHLLADVLDDTRWIRVRDPANPQGKIGWGKLAVASWLGNARYATDDQVANFLQWNHYRLHGLRTNLRAREVIADSKLAYGQAVIEALGKGWLAADSVPAMAPSRARGVATSCQDIFETEVKGLLGYHSHGTVMLSPSLYDQALAGDEAFSVSYWHELTHATMQQVRLVPWLNEARIEHVTQVLRRGRPNVIHPQKRPDDYGVYVAGRSLAALLLERDGITRPGHLLIQAGYAVDETARLHHTIDRAWGQRSSGRHAVDIVNDKIAAEQDRLVRTKDTYPREAYRLAIATAAERLQQDGPAFLRNG